MRIHLKANPRGNGAVGTPPTPLKKGDLIGLRQQFNGWPQTLASLAFSPTCPGDLCFGGPWPHFGQVRYLGLSFLIDGETYYGWAKVQFFIIRELGPTKLELRLTGYAYRQRDANQCGPDEVIFKPWEKAST